MACGPPGLRAEACLKSTKKSITVPLIFDGLITYSSTHFSAVTGWSVVVAASLSLSIRDTRGPTVEANVNDRDSTSL
jgi:hypothetical protein